MLCVLVKTVLLFLLVALIFVLNPCTEEIVFTECTESFDGFEGKSQQRIFVLLTYFNHTLLNFLPNMSGSVNLRFSFNMTKWSSWYHSAHREAFVTSMSEYDYRLEI